MNRWDLLRIAADRAVTFGSSAVELWTLDMIAGVEWMQGRGVTKKDQARNGKAETWTWARVDLAG
jgi:hypothetical protein